VDAHRLICGEFEFDQGMVSQFFTTSVLARANAAMFWLQFKELLKHNPKLAEYLPPWLKPLYSPQVLLKLREFSSALRKQLVKFGTFAGPECDLCLARARSMQTEMNIISLCNQVGSRFCAKLKWSFRDRSHQRRGLCGASMNDSWGRKVW
jgi:hypothetical protein